MITSSPGSINHCKWSCALPSLEGTHTAPDGSRMEWCTRCPNCPWRAACRHNCGHPGQVAYLDADGYRVGTVSGKIKEEDIARRLKAFKAEHNGQMRLL